jgi:hypothetical protein
VLILEYFIAKSRGMNKDDRGALSILFIIQIVISVCFNKSHYFSLQNQLMSTF